MFSSSLTPPLSFSRAQVLAGMWAAARDERTRAEAEAAILYRNKTAVSEVSCGQM